MTAWTASAMEGSRRDRRRFGGLPDPRTAYLLLGRPGAGAPGRREAPPATGESLPSQARNCALRASACRVPHPSPLPCCQRL